MEIKFNIKEFVITGDTIPIEVADKILKYHITPMLKVRQELNIPLFPSQKSGYRPRSWELNKGRSGNSQHTFTGKGAVDWTCKEFDKNKDKLLKAICDYTDYTRIAIYNSFIHCDYLKVLGGGRAIYTSDSASQWIIKERI